MKAAIITAAGISSRFNAGTAEEEKCLKSIYQESKGGDTLLLHLLIHCSYAEKIIVVGGYRFQDLEAYIKNDLPKSLSSKVVLVCNPYYEKRSSGYSLYVGLKEAFKERELKEVLFVEGDLDIDEDSFRKVIKSDSDVLTYNYKPINTKNAVVLYRTQDNRYHYAFNTHHGLLTIKDSFSCILNSGQLWKFTDINALTEACRIFHEGNQEGTNLAIIQEYIDRIAQEHIAVLGLRRWTNCNTREDFHKITKIWEEEA